MTRGIVALAVVFSCAVVVVVPARGDYAAGRAAYLMGNYAKAMTEFKADKSPQSMYQMGYMYGHGEGVPQDLKASAEWYRQAAEKGSVPAQYRLGALYANGTGVGKDLKEAARWYKMAADKGFQPAKDALKKMEKAQ